MSSLPKMRELSPARVHNSTIISEHAVTIESRNGQRKLTGMVNGQECSVQTHIKVMEDAGAGLQGFSFKQIGELQSMAGSMVDVDTNQIIFSIVEKKLWPNFCMRVLSLLVNAANSVQAVEVELCDNGKAVARAPLGVSTRGATLSLASIHYVQREVTGSTDIVLEGGWKKAPRSHSYYHKLDMGSNTVLCVLAGTLTTTWGAGQSSVITAKLPSECTKDYKEGFTVGALVMVDGEKQWIDKATGTFPFQLFVKGRNVELRTGRTDLKGKTLTLSVDGVSLVKQGDDSSASQSDNAEADARYTALGEVRRFQGRWIRNKAETKELRDLEEGIDEKAAAAAKKKADGKAAKKIKKAAEKAAKMNEEENAATKQANDKLAKKIKKAEDKLAAKVAQLKTEHAAETKELKAKVAAQNCVQDAPHKKELPILPSTSSSVVDTTGFSMISSSSLVVMGQDVDSRTCVLRGVVEFTSDNTTATAWLDPNHRDPVTQMPLCSPISGTMQFLASIVNPKDTLQIERTVALQIEPHGR